MLVLLCGKGCSSWQERENQEVSGLGTYRDVDQGDAGAEIGVWFDFVDEGVLAEVADHHSDAHLDEGDDEDEEGWLELVPCHEVDEAIGGKLRECGSDCQGGFALSQEVERELEPYQE